MGKLTELARKFGLPLVRYSGGVSVPFEKQCVRCQVRGASQVTVTGERPTLLGKLLGIRSKTIMHQGMLSGGCGGIIAGCPDRKPHDHIIGE